MWPPLRPRRKLRQMDATTLSTARRSGSLTPFSPIISRWQCAPAKKKVKITKKFPFSLVLLLVWAVFRSRLNKFKYFARHGRNFASVAGERHARPPDAPDAVLGRLELWNDVHNDGGRQSARGELDWYSFLYQCGCHCCDG